MNDYVVIGNDMKTPGTCLECEFYRDCDAHCFYDYYEDPEEPDNEEAEV